MGFSTRLANRMGYRQDMPKPEFTRDDYQNPDAPENERLIRSDHPRVRDLSYDQGRTRQEIDMWKGALQQVAMDPWEHAEEPGVGEPGPSLELFIKERPRGRGYVCDFVYRARGLPVTVYGTIANEGHGLFINELELWRGGRFSDWEYRDEWGDYIGPEAWRQQQADDTGSDEADASDRPRAAYSGVSTSTLRQIPLGEILASAERALASRDWTTEGVSIIPGPTLHGDDIPQDTRRLLEATNALAEGPRRGRPPLDDDLLAEVAHAYLEEATSGRGLIRRLAHRFDRPEPTVRDWVAAARKRGFLSPATPGRRGGTPGERLPS